MFRTGDIVIVDVVMRMTKDRIAPSAHENMGIVPKLYSHVRIALGCKCRCAPRGWSYSRHCIINIIVKFCFTACTLEGKNGFYT